MSRTAEFSVFGEPKGKERPRAKIGSSGQLYVYTPSKTKEYEERVKEALCKENGSIFFDRSTPVFVYIDAFFTLRGKKNQVLNPKNIFPKKPDCDNIAKTICDALNGVAYEDDSQIVFLQVSKHFTVGEPYVKVTIGCQTN